MWAGQHDSVFSGPLFSRAFAGSSLAAVSSRQVPVQKPNLDAVSPCLESTAPKRPQEGHVKKHRTARFGLFFPEKDCNITLKISSAGPHGEAKRVRFGLLFPAFFAVQPQEVHFGKHARFGLL